MTSAAVAGAVAVVLAAVVPIAGCRRGGVRAQDGAPAGTSQDVAGAARDAGAVVEICVGAAHSCARAGDGTVACWGDNGNHQIALSDEAQLDAPHVVDALPRAEALRCAAASTCVLDGGGAIHCLGGGEKTVMRMPGGARARDFVVTGDSICARDGGGRVVCWDGPPGTPPIEVGDAAGATAFATAAYDARRVCVARGDGAPVCFDAQLWDPLAARARLAVRNVARLDALAGARALAAVGIDAAVVCGLRPGGGIACLDRSGRSPAAPSSWSLPPDQPAVGFAATFATTWSDTTCLRVAGAGGPGVRCFEELRSKVAGAVPAGATAVALSADHACALVGGGVRCWGAASRGQLGSGTRYLHPTPVPVAGVGDAVMLASGWARACALRAGGAITCWGRHEETDDFAPIDLPGAAPAKSPPLEIVPHGGPAGPLCARWQGGWFCHNGFEWFPRPTNLATADRHFKTAGLRMRQIAGDEACGVDEAARLVCAGCTRGDCTRAAARAALTAFDPGAPARTPEARFREATSLYDHGAERFVCGVTMSGRVRCYHAGKAPFERIADPSPIAEPTIDALTDVAQIESGDGGDRNEAGGDGFACALRRNGEVWCWGSNRFGQLGVAPVAWRSAAARVEGLPPAAEIAVGRTFVCARAKEGTGPGQVHCWGSNRDGGVPDGSAGEEAQPVTSWQPSSGR